MIGVGRRTTRIRSRQQRTQRSQRTQTITQTKETDIGTNQPTIMTTYANTTTEHMEGNNVKVYDITDPCEFVPFFVFFFFFFFVCEELCVSLMRCFRTSVFFHSLTHTTTHALNHRRTHHNTLCFPISFVSIPFRSI